MSESDSGGRRVSPAFRSMLRRELNNWVDEGVVDADQSAAISKRYGLDDVAGRSGGLLVQALYLIGAVLIGGGAISFVASRWDEIPVPGRMSLLVGTLLACEIAGFYLWKLSGSRKRLGEALIVLGALVFGANVFLIAQMFHLTGEPHGAFGIWALGSAVIAFATMSGPCMLVTCVASFAWFCGYTANNPHMFCWYPFAIVAVCVPFLMRRSAAAFARRHPGGGGGACGVRGARQRRAVAAAPRHSRDRDVPVWTGPPAGQGPIRTLDGDHCQDRWE